MSMAGMLPHQVEILYDFEGGGNATVCAGTIISSYLVLTVATCLAGRNESLFKIRANGKNQNESQIRTIDQVHSYAALDSDPSPFDVALIRLNSELELDKNHTSKIPYYRNQVVLVLDSSQKRKPYYYEPGVSRVRTIQLSECSETLEGKEGDKFMCTEPVENIGGSFHQLPGSSLICSGILCGLFSMSWSNHEEIQEKRVYTSVAAYSRWIRFALDPREAEEAEENDFLPEVEDSLFGQDVVQITDPVPYQLSIRFKGSHNCGGVILDKKTALSAAHCFTSQNMSLYTVVAGEFNVYKKDSTEQILQIEKLFVHPKYKSVFDGNDLAVIQVKGEFNFTERVNSVWISSPSNKIRSLEEFRGTTMGWGKTSTRESFSPFLLSLDLDFLCRSKCKRKWGFYKNSMICGYSHSSNTCKGDSGGPLVIKYHDDGPHTNKDLLVGILSFGPNNCRQMDAPSGFTNVPYFYDWIAEKRSNSLCSSTQFQCFNGQCIHEELKCDKKFDCEDGSDEKMCSSYKKVTGVNDTFCDTKEWGQNQNVVPYQLSIRLNGSHVCDAVILDKMTALSAAHCFDEEPYERMYTLAVGEQNLSVDENDSREIFQMQKVFVHPNYTDFLGGNDIAVIRVQREFSFSKRVNNLWILSPRTPGFEEKRKKKLKLEIFQKDRLDFLGLTTDWRQTERAGQFSSVGQSRELELKFTDGGQCTRGWDVLKGSRLCGKNNASNICGGGSGGPLVIKNYEHRPHTRKDLLVGFISFGPSRCEEKGFTNVSHFYDWIAEVRSPSLGLPSKFQCWNGQYIPKDYQCDDESDCWDRSDEKMCESHSRVSAPCGGFINLAALQRPVIFYRVPSGERQRQRDSICLWIISAGRTNAEVSIEAKILNNPSAQFNSTSDIIFASHSFTAHNKQFSIIDEIGVEYSVPGPFMALYYRTNSLAANAGFKLKLKVLVTKRFLWWPLDGKPKLVSVPNANLKEGEIREFSYPPNSSGSSAGASNSKYSSNERTFFILKPQKPGTKIRVNLTFVDTEKNYDWLEIITYRVKPTLLFRFSGRSNWSEKTVEGLEGEPLVFYFHSNKRREGEGFKIQYSEITARKPLTSCGGFIRLGGEQEIVYKVPENLHGEKSVCLWVVVTAGASTIQTKVYSNPRAHFEPGESTLFALYDFKINGSSHLNLLSKETWALIDHPFFILHFRTNSSAPNSGFHIHLKEAGVKERQRNVKYLEVESKDGPTFAIQEFKYPPPPASKYASDERTFIIVKPQTSHGKLTLDLKSVDTEEDDEWMEILTVKTEPVSEFRFSGQGLWSDKSFEGEKDEPFIIYFHSAKNTTGSGFQLFYSENDPESVTTSCGGFINLERGHEIIYKVPSDEDELQGKRDSVCLWLVSTGRTDDGASIEATILKNSSAQFNSTTDIIFANYNFTADKSWNKLVNQLGVKYRIFGPFLTLYYRTNSSAPNAGLHLKLKDSIFESSITEQLNVKLITLPNVDLDDGEIQEFSFSTSESVADVEAVNGNETGASNSRSNASSIEHTFFILKPQKPGAKIRVGNLTIVDPGKNDSWLEISTHRVNPTNLIRVSSQNNWNWSEKTIEGLEDEPLYFYFHSNKRREGEGFKIQYSEIAAPKPSPCGGFIHLKGEAEIVYKVPKELHGEKLVCVWVVATAGASEIEYEVLSNPRAHFEPLESTIFAIHDFTPNGFNNTNILGKDEALTFDQPFLVLYFRSNSSAPNSGFHIRLKEAGKKETQKAVKYLELTPSLADGATSAIQEFKYPQPPASNYTNDERTFIILKPQTIHGKLKLDLKSVSTERWNDWIDIFSVKTAPNSEFRFFGDGSWSDNYFEADEDEPFIIYFHSDKNTTGSGFQLFYSEPKDPQSITTSCGGFINLDLVHEIIYKVPSEKDQRRRDSICLWVVSTGRKDDGASIEATILNNPSVQFNSSSDVIFANYNFTIYISNYETINEIGVEYSVPGPFMALYYRTNSSAPNAGFHLRLKDSITQSNITERLDVKLIPVPSVGLNEGEIQEFSYPSKSSVSSTGASNSNHSSNERTFFILKPQKPGAKIRVNLTFLDTDRTYDWVEINTYRKRPRLFTRLSGRGYWLENILEGLEDEPLLFYFHSNGSIQGEGFKIQYSETLAPSPCGGFIRFEREREIVFQVPEELRGEKSVCVWVIATAGATGMELELLSNREAQFQPEESTLFALYDFKMNGSEHRNILGKDEALTFDQPFLVLYFRSNSSAPNSGFHIQFKEAGKKETQKAVKYLELTSNLTDGATSAIQEFKYPQPPASKYANDERTFIIVKPQTIHGKLKLDLKSVETEQNSDWMELLSVRSKPTSEFRFDGNGSLSNKTFEAEEDEPFIIYFHSDKNTTESGFQLSHSEKKGPQSITTTCGGFIKLDHVHEIIYQVPSEKRQRGRDSICLWIVSTGRTNWGASIKARILDNPSAQLNSNSDVIIASYNFIFSGSHNKVINEVGKNYTIPAPFTTVYYRSNSSAPNAGLHLKLKDSITQSNFRERLHVKLIPLPNADLNEGEIREFSYPSNSSGSSAGASNSKYSSDERTFFILKPQKPGAKIRVNLTFLDTERKYGWLEVSSYLVGPKPLARFSGRVNWTEKILEGLEDEPLLFYFHSNGWFEGKGFKIQYSETLAPSPCGGFIRFEREREIVYKVPENLRGEKCVCVWVIATAVATAMEIELLSNPKAHFEPPETTLLAIHDFTQNSVNNTNMLNKDERLTIHQPFFLLYFRTNSSAPNTGFHIRLKEASNKETQKAVQYLELTSGATSAVQEFKYPLPPASKYANDERTFIIVKPRTSHGKLKLDLKSVDTEENSDWMEILSVKAEPTSEFRFSGQGVWSNKSFEAEEDEPFIIYFHSNKNATGFGFQFSYSEQ